MSIQRHYKVTAWFARLSHARAEKQEILFTSESGITAIADGLRWVVYAFYNKDELNKYSHVNRIDIAGHQIESVKSDGNCMTGFCMLLGIPLRWTREDGLKWPNLEELTTEATALMNKIVNLKREKS